MIDAKVVANYFISLASKKQNTLTPMQLLKLVYIAHGYRLGAFGVPLINNRIEAWKFGPVIPDLYHSIKQHRDQPVPELSGCNVDGLSESEKSFIADVYDAYEGFSGLSLSNLTHEPGTPWYQVFRNDTAGILIPNDLIESHYSTILQVGD